MRPSVSSEQWWTAWLLDPSTAAKTLRPKIIRAQRGARPRRGHRPEDPVLAFPVAHFLTRAIAADSVQALSWLNDTLALPWPAIPHLRHDLSSWASSQTWDDRRSPSGDLALNGNLLTLAARHRAVGVTRWLLDHGVCADGSLPQRQPGEAGHGLHPGTLRPWSPDLLGDFSSIAVPHQGLNLHALNRAWLQAWLNDPRTETAMRACEPFGLVWPARSWWNDSTFPTGTSPAALLSFLVQTRASDPDGALAHAVLARLPNLYVPLSPDDHRGLPLKVTHDDGIVGLPLVDAWLAPLIQKGHVERFRTAMEPVFAWPMNARRFLTNQLLLPILVRRMLSFASNAPWLQHVDGFFETLSNPALGLDLHDPDSSDALLSILRISDDGSTHREHVYQHLHRLGWSPVEAGERYPNGPSAYWRRVAESITPAEAHPRHTDQMIHSLALWMDFSTRASLDRVPLSFWNHLVDTTARFTTPADPQWADPKWMSALFNHLPADAVRPGLSLLQTLMTWTPSPTSAEAWARLARSMVGKEAAFLIEWAVDRQQMNDAVWLAQCFPDSAKSARPCFRHLPPEGLSLALVQIGLAMGWVMNPVDEQGQSMATRWFQQWSQKHDRTCSIFEFRALERDAPSDGLLHFLTHVGLDDVLYPRAISKPDETFDNETPFLVRLARDQHWTAVDLLFRAGADPNVTDAQGCTALSYVLMSHAHARARNWRTPFAVLTGQAAFADLALRLLEASPTLPRLPKKQTLSRALDRSSFRDGLAADYPELLASIERRVLQHDATALDVLPALPSASRNNRL